LVSIFNDDLKEHLAMVMIN